MLAITELMVCSSVTKTNFCSILTPAELVSCIVLYSREPAEVSFTDFLVIFLILYALILHTAIIPYFIHIITEHNCMNTGRY